MATLNKYWGSMTKKERSEEMRRRAQKRYKTHQQVVDRWNAESTAKQVEHELAQAFPAIALAEVARSQGFTKMTTNLETGEVTLGR